MDEGQDIIMEQLRKIKSFNEERTKAEKGSKIIQVIQKDFKFGKIIKKISK